MASLGRLWGSSLLFRRIVAASIFVLACLLVYLGSNIPRAVSLPDDDLNAKSFARLGEEKIVLEKPDIQEGGLALSYVGSKNEVADLWLTNATLDEGSRRLLLPGSKLQQPAVVSYITGGQTKSAPTDDTCHTTIEVRRAPGSPPIDALTLYQSDESAGPQRFRQIVLDAGTTPMQVEVHTDPPPQGGMDAPGCNKMLTVGTNPPIEMPPIPVRFLVSGGKIDLHFNPSSPAVSIWTGTAQTFESVSLGDNNLHGAGLKVLTAKQIKAPPKLEVRASPAASEISFNHLKLGSDMLRLDVGADGDKASAYRDGHSMYNYDLIAAIQKNTILGYVLGAVLVVFIGWVKKVCFPSPQTPAPAPGTNPKE